MGHPAARQTDGVTHNNGGGNILKGSTDVMVNGLPAARQTDAVQHNNGTETITQGASTVKANNLPMARVTDQVACGGEIASGSSDVFIGTGVSGRACSTCPGGVTTGDPVNPILGAKVLLGSDELDLALPGAMPFLIQRQYTSYVNAEHGAPAGLMGYGWKLPLEQSVRLTADACVLFDSGGRAIRFDALAPGGMDYSVVDDLRVMRGLRVPRETSEVDSSGRAVRPQVTIDPQVPAPAGRALPEHPEHPAYDIAGLPWYRQPQWQHIPEVMRYNANYVFAAGSNRNVWVFVKPNGQTVETHSDCHLLCIIDPLGRVQRNERDERDRVMYVTDGVGRRYALRYEQILEAPTSALVPKNAVRNGAASASPIPPTGPYFQPDGGERLVGIDLIRDPYASGHFDVDRDDPGIPLVRYRYSNVGDLIAVENRHGECVRRFAYQNHMMVEHRVRGGPAHRYTYEHSPPLPGDKVLAQDNEGALSYRFEYVEDAADVAVDPPRGRSIVTDSLGRREVYYCEGTGGNKRVVTHTRADGTSTHVQTFAGQRTIVTDPLGRSTHLEYDSQGRSSGAMYPDGSRSSAKWNHATGLLTSTSSTDGQVTSFEYDRWGRMTATIEADGRTTRYHYADLPESGEFSLDTLYAYWRLTADLPIAVTDPQGGVKHMSWTVLGQLASNTDCSGKTTGYQYDALGQIIRVTDALGRHFSTEYDALGRVQAMRAADGSVTQVRYHPRGWVSELINPMGQITHVQYDAQGRVTRRTQGEATLGFQYDEAGRLIVLVNENGASSQFGYDPLDRLVQETGFDGRVVSYCYNAAGEMQASADGRALEAHEWQTLQEWVDAVAGYDNGPINGEMPQSADRLEPPTLPQAFGARQDAETLAKQLRVTGYRYDRMGRLTERQVCASSLNTPTRHLFSYDAAGALISLLAVDTATGCTLSRVDRTHDPLGRLTGEAQYLFDEQGQTVLHHRLAHRLGPMGQRESTTLNCADGRLADVGYLSYGAGHLHGVTLDREPLLSIERDDLHRETLRHIPALSIRRDYDAAGRLRTQRVEGVKVDHGNYSNSDNDAWAPWHPSVLVPQLDRNYGYDALGQMIEVREPGLQAGHQPGQQQMVYRRYAYDMAGRLIASTRAGQAHQNDYRFDRAGNRLPMPVSLPVAPEHRAQAQAWVEEVRDNLHDVHFDVLSQNAGLLLHTETVERWLDNRVHHHAGVRYSYDVWGNRVEAVHPDGTRQCHGYDGLHQLTQVECFHGSRRTSRVRYRYDAMGRRLATIVQTATPGAPAESTKTTYYGWDGNRLVYTETEREVRNTVYEPYSFVPMLVVTSQKAEWPELPPALQALQQQLPSETEKLLNTGLISSMPRYAASRLGLTDEQLSEQVDEVRQARRDAADKAEMAIHHIYCDHLGTPLALFDLQGKPVWLGEYDDWGRLVGEFNPLLLEQSIRFQGQQWDAETGLHYNRYRYYDPKLGSYITSDPIGFAGGVNTYAYIDGNPLRFSDHLGLRPITQSESYALKVHFGDCLDSIMSQLDVNVRRIGDTRRALSLENGFISFPSDMFLGGNPENSLDLSTPYNFSVFGHELLHQLQRLNGVNVTGEAFMLQIKYSLGSDVYSYPASTDPEKMLTTFKNANVEQQGQMFQDYLYAYDSGADTSAFASIAAFVKLSCVC